MSDAFTPLFGDSRGLVRACPRPLYRLDPSDSTCAPVLTLADFNRRLRVGVIGALDTLDGYGRRLSRVVGTVRRVRDFGSPFFVLVDGAGHEHSARYPKRSRPRWREGASWFSGYTGAASPDYLTIWRFTFLDETNGIDD